MPCKTFNFDYSQDFRQQFFEKILKKIKVKRSTKRNIFSEVASHIDLIWPNKLIGKSLRSKICGFNILKDERVALSI